MKHLIWTMVAISGITAGAQQLVAPASVGIVLDASGSMRSKSGLARQLAMGFVQANPQDEFCVVKFNDEPSITSALTTDAGKIQSDLNLIQPRGGSALWDAVYLTLNEVRQGAGPRKLLLVISDGGDNSSHYTENEIANAVRLGAIPIYAVGLSEAAPSRTRSSEELRGATRLRRIAEQSGGRYFAIEGVDDIQVVVTNISAQIQASVPAPR